MKFEPDTEIDGLLRRHARRRTTAASLAAGGGAGGKDESASRRDAGGAHLDADEMNAYAEGAVPDKLRTRYVAHLADCDECRRLVTQLTLAAGAGVHSNARRDEPTPSRTRSWREWLAALFAPSVLRYGVPALALFAVVVIALVVTRDRSSQVDLVAQNEQAKDSSARPQVTQNAPAANTPTTGTTAAPFEDSASNANSGAAVNNQRQANTAAETAATKQKDADVKQEAPAQESEPKPAGQPRDFGGVLREQKRDTEEAVTMARQMPLPTPPATAAAPVSKSTSEEDEQRRREEETAKAGGAAAKNSSPEPARSADRSNNYTVDGLASGSRTETQNAPENGARVGAAMRRARQSKPQPGSEGAGRAARDERTVETRSAGGRSFRRQDGAWVDTAYSSSRSTINIARGSEQFRALIADEPGIRAITDQLGGTLIIVWKNRAYRIY